MTTQIEVLDALPGSGKTTAIFTYMSEHQEKPWLWTAKRRRQVVAVCKQIKADDTGHTDSLTQALADQYLNLEMRYQAICKKS